MSCEPWRPLEGEPIRLKKPPAPNAVASEEPQCPECGGTMEEQDDGSFCCDDCGYEE